MRCSMCGHDSPPGSLFCLSCGSPLQPGGTPAAAGGLPTVCPSCRTENPPGMKFCRHCGTVLQQAAPGLPPSPGMGYGPPGGGYGVYGASPPGPPPGPPMGVAPTMAAPGGDAP